MSELTRRCMVMALTTAAPFAPTDQEAIFVLEPRKDSAARRTPRATSRARRRP